MRNSSQKAGCMRRLPASHSCHPRSVQWIRAAAAVCESPDGIHGQRRAWKLAQVDEIDAIAWVIGKLNGHE